MIKWTFEGDGIYSLHSPLVGRDGTIYVQKGTGDYMTGNDTMYALSPEGKMKWKYERPELRFSLPVLSPDGGVVYLAATDDTPVMTDDKPDSYLIAIGAADGKFKWEKHLSEHYTETWFSHIVCDSSGIIYAHIGDILGAFKPDGEKIWSYRMVMDPAEKTGYARHTSGPTLSPDEKTVYLLKRFGGGLMAFDSLTGRVLWHDKTKYYSDYSSPVVGPDGTIYIPDSETKSFHAINRNGSLKWKVRFKEESAGNANASIGKDGTVYITTEGDPERSKIYALSKENGAIIWSYEFRGNLASPPAVDRNGRIYIGTGDGHVVCLDGRGKLLWNMLVGYKVPNGHSGDDFSQIYMSGVVLSNGNAYVVVGRLSKTSRLVAVGSM